MSGRFGDAVSRRGSCGRGDPLHIAFASAHGLVPGQAVTAGGEIRFAAAIVDVKRSSLTRHSQLPRRESQTGPTVTYQPANDLSSVTIFDYWSPATSVQRILSGAAVDELKVDVNGDFHEFVFSGQARDLVDNSSFESGQCGLSAFLQSHRSRATPTQLCRGTSVRCGWEALPIGSSH